VGELSIVGKKSMVMTGEPVEGELKFNWRNDNAEEVTLAEKTFKEYIIRGWLAVGEKSGKKTQIFIFDPNFDRIVLGPIAAGG
jgi:hypothetical protein